MAGVEGLAPYLARSIEIQEIREKLIILQETRRGKVNCATTSGKVNFTTLIVRIRVNYLVSCINVSFFCFSLACFSFTSL